MGAKLQAEFFFCCLYFINEKVIKSLDKLHESCTSCLLLLIDIKRRNNPKKSQELAASQKRQPVGSSGHGTDQKIILNSEAENSSGRQSFKGQNGLILDAI